VTDLIVFVAVVVLPWVAIGLLRLWRRGEPREDGNALDEAGEGILAGILGAVFPWWRG
jgi:hypothetical protein